jgi:hypothetical protein
MFFCPRLPAGAVQTPMLTAGPAVARDLFAEMFPGAMQPDGEIVFAQPEFRCDFAGVRPVQINALQQFPIWLRNGGQEPLEALAKQPFLARVWGIGQFLLKPLQCSPARIPAAVEVNDGTAQNPVEPRRSVLLFGRLFGRRQRFDKTVLHHVFCQMRITKALAGERHKGLQILEQGFFYMIHRSDIKRGTQPVKP